MTTENPKEKFKGLDPEIVEILEMMTEEEPDEKDLERIIGYLEKNPNLYYDLFPVPAVVEKGIIHNTFPQPVIEILVQGNLAQIREEMGYGKAPALERILIDNLTNCWIRLQMAENMHANALNQQGDQYPYYDQWEKRLNSTFTRFLKACDSYMKFKKNMSKVPGLNG